MLPDYTYYRPAAPDEELSAYFAERLRLRRVEGTAPFPLQSDRWWVRTVDSDEDWEEEAARIEITAEAMVLVVFEPSKGLGIDESSKGDADFFAAVVDQLNDDPVLSGLLQHGDVKVLIERSPGSPTLVDSSLAAPEDYNRGNHLAPVLSQGIVTDLVDFG